MISNHSPSIRVLDLQNGDDNSMMAIIYSSGRFQIAMNQCSWDGSSTHHHSHSICHSIFCFVLYMRRTFHDNSSLCWFRSINYGCCSRDRRMLLMHVPVCFSLQSPLQVSKFIGTSPAVMYVSCLLKPSFLFMYSAILWPTVLDDSLCCTLDNPVYLINTLLI